ncbi:LysR family transcriptional regulator [Rhizorhabdus dicambivorans]|uniref:LysR family transcriptional regulator n=1 Tax=Rhizorhabdus dicambivorans TaxID=1850238 RepID=A0A2A4FRD5_9SPHN|nr:LysR family transcriptional regulator [Rhizorhabdus dicambivorans]ATE64742.1 LysR family transcriptional regulator [Rhizorhabdus dicambivorans]PCE41315.1 LysR family transcriptional regulator [Rhizorhabdus dicambivorans]
MDLRQLRYFVAVAELRSFTDAASRLNIVQSALSRQISRLQEDLGVALFARDGRRVRLTRAGTRLLDAATQLLLDAEALRSLVRDAADEVVGTVNFGAHPSDGNILFPLLFKKARELYPAVHIDPVQSMTSELQELLVKGRLDLAIVTFPDPIAGIDVQPLAREKFYLLAPAAMHPLPSGACTMRQALGVPLILSRLPHRERSNIEALAKKSRISLDVRVEADTLPLMKSLAMLGYGSLLLPETAVLEERSNPAWHATLLSDLTLTRYIARRVTPAPSNAITCVYEILMEEIENLKKAGVMF